MAAHRQDRPWIGQEVRAAEAVVPPYVADCYLCPGQRARERRAQSAVHGHVRLRQRSPVASGRSRRRCSRRPPGSTATGRLPAWRASSATARATTSRSRSWSRRRSTGCSRSGRSSTGIWADATASITCSSSRTRAKWSASRTRTRIARSTRRTSCSRRSRPRRVRASGTWRRPAACCSRTSSRRNTPTAAASSRRTTRRLRSCRTSRATRTKCSWRRRRRTRVSRHCPTAERRDLAAVLQDVLVRFDNLWQMPFPYVMPLHQAPTDGREYPGFHFHIEFHPPLAEAQPAQVPRGPGDRRRELPERYGAGREGRRAARAAGGSLQEGAVMAAVDRRQAPGSGLRAWSGFRLLVPDQPWRPERGAWSRP